MRLGCFLSNIHGTGVLYYAPSDEYLDKLNASKYLLIQSGNYGYIKNTNNDTCADL